MIETCYKILRKNDFDAYVSCSPPLGCGLRYLLDVWVSPKIEKSKIFVFKDLNFAFKFGKDNGFNQYIFECEAENVTEIGVMCDPLDATIYQVEYLWKGLNTNQSIIKPVPEGSFVADRVKIKKLLYRNQWYRKFTEVDGSKKPLDAPATT